MSGSPLASAPPITVTQENGASATVPTPNQTPTYPRTGPTEGARAHCPARMQKQKRRGSHMPVQPMPDPAQTRSTETQTKTIETARVQTAFCTSKPETAANREDPTPNALQEPHAFLAGLRRTTARPSRCGPRSERAPSTRPSAKPPTPSSSSDKNSATSPRRPSQSVQHTLPGCCDGQQPGSSYELHARPPIATNDNNDNSSHCPRNSRRCPAPEQKREPAGPWLAPAEHSIRTRAARAAPPALPKPCEPGIISLSFATGTAATPSSTSRPLAAKPVHEDRQPFLQETAAPADRAPPTTDARAFATGSYSKQIKSTAERDCSHVGRLTALTSRFTYMMMIMRARRQTRLDWPPMTRLSNSMRVIMIALMKSTDYERLRGPRASKIKTDLLINGE